MNNICPGIDININIRADLAYGTKLSFKKRRIRHYLN